MVHAIFNIPLLFEIINNLIIGRTPDKTTVALCIEGLVNY